MKCNLFYSALAAVSAFDRAHKHKFSLYRVYGIQIEMQKALLHIIATLSPKIWKLYFNGFFSWVWRYLRLDYGINSVET